MANPTSWIKAREHKHMTMYEAAKDRQKKVGAPKLWLDTLQPFYDET